MVKYISTAVFSILLFAVIILTAINFHNNDVLESRINTIVKINEKSMDTKKEYINSFKEDYYILQQSHDTNLILVVFGLVVAVIGFFTYQNVIAKFDLKATELKNEIIIYKNEGEAIIDSLGNLQIEFYLQSAELLKETASNRLSRGNKTMFVYHTIASISKTADVCLFGINNKRENNLVDIEDTKRQIVIALRSVNRIMGSTFEINSKYLTMIEHYISDIRKIESDEANKILSEIHSKLKEKIPSSTT